jgi:hypothetical protein
MKYLNNAYNKKNVQVMISAWRAVGRETENRTESLLTMWVCSVPPFAIGGTPVQMCYSLDQ